MSQPQEINPSGQITQAQAPASGVSVPAHMGVGTDLVHSLDYVVMLQVMFNLASGVKTTPMAVWQQLQDRGIRSAKNSRELVGKNAVYESFARLVEAGYLRRQQLPHPTLAGRKGPVVYQMYDNPAWNPDWQAQQAGTDPLREPSANAQVGTLPGTPDPSFGEPGKTAGGDASRNGGSVNPGSGVPGSVNAPVPAGRNASLVPGRGMAPPPHPPEGGGTTSPSPPKTGRVSKADRWAASCALDPEDYKPTAEEIRAADAFLQDLPGKWQMAADEARLLAPLLASRVHTQGYELDTLLELILVQDDPNDPARVPARVMPIRIRGLKRKRAESKPGTPSTATGAIPWCGECNKGEKPAETFQRTVEQPDGSDLPCKACHPKYARSAA